MAGNWLKAGAGNVLGYYGAILDAAAQGGLTVQTLWQTIRSVQAAYGEVAGLPAISAAQASVLWGAANGELAAARSFAALPDDAALTTDQFSAAVWAAENPSLNPAQRYQVRYSFTAIIDGEEQTLWSTFSLGTQLSGTKQDLMGDLELDLATRTSDRYSNVVGGLGTVLLLRF